jgi:NAD-dependent oxidoreductase involved in siderophore biosynthesis
MAVTFVTCCDQPGEALPLLNKALAERGVEVMAEISLTPEDTKNPAAGNELLSRIAAAFPVRPDDGKNGDGMGI